VNCSASVAITTGLLQKLDREELQGVLGHELSHVRNFDIRFALLVAVLVGSIALLADFFLRFTFWGGGRRSSRDRDGGGGALIAIVYVIAIVLAILAPIIGWLSYRDEPTLSLLDRVAIPFYLSGLLAGPAYVPFAAALFWWLRDEPAARYRAISWKAPLLFLPVFLVYLLAMRWWTGSTAPLVETLLFYGLVVLLFGYGYVLLIHAGRRALDRRGAIEVTPARL